MKTDSIQKEISMWAEQTFGPTGSNASVATRANKEMSELLHALALSDSNPEAHEEVADVVMVLYRLADRMGFNLDEAVAKKLAINKARQWKLDGNGHGYHAKEKPCCGHLDSEHMVIEGAGLDDEGVIVCLHKGCKCKQSAVAKEEQ